MEDVELLLENLVNTHTVILKLHHVGTTKRLKIITEFLTGDEKSMVEGKSGDVIIVVVVFS